MLRFLETNCACEPTFALKVSLLARNRVISSVFNNDYAAAG
jgi:hypothetical protein